MTNNCELNDQSNVWVTLHDKAINKSVSAQYLNTGRATGYIYIVGTFKTIGFCGGRGRISRSNWSMQYYCNHILQLMHCSPITERTTILFIPILYSTLILLVVGGEKAVGVGENNVILFQNRI